MSKPLSTYFKNIKDLAGKEWGVDVDNKVVLVVNVASKCGFTSQYKGLETLYKQFKDKAFTIVGVPCNQFGSQEPGSAEEIQSFCSRTYDVTFPLTEKLDVNGDKESELYKHLKDAKPGIMGIKMVKWNFEKFLVDRNGKVVNRYISTTKPEKIAADIEKLLKEEPEPSKTTSAEAAKPVPANAEPTIPETAKPETTKPE